MSTSAAASAVAALPRWSRHVLAPAALILAGLMVLFDSCPCPDHSEHFWGVRVAAVVLAGVWLAEAAVWHERLPRIGLLLGTILLVTVVLLMRHGSLTPMFLLLAAAWVAGTGSARNGWLALGGSLVGLAPWTFEPDAAVAWSLGTLAIWVAARSLAQQHRLLTEQRRLVTELRAAQATLAGRVAADERRRIAREIHDVVAHSFTVTMLHLPAPATSSSGTRNGPPRRSPRRSGWVARAWPTCGAPSGSWRRSTGWLPHRRAAARRAGDPGPRPGVSAGWSGRRD